MRSYICLSVMAVPACILAILTAYAGAKEGMPREREMGRLLKGIHTRQVKKAVATNWPLLSRDVPRFLDGVDFFHDIRAKEPLACLMFSQNAHKQGVVVLKCLDLLDAPDLLMLYKLTTEMGNKSRALGLGEHLGAHQRLIGALVLRSQAILGLDPSEVPNLEMLPDAKEVHIWWRAALRVAKAERSYFRFLNESAQYFEKTPPLPIRKRDRLEEARALLLKHLRSKQVKEMVQDRMPALRAEAKESNDLRRDAVLFFRDIKGKGVLLAILASEDYELRQIVLEECMGIFAARDVVPLYEAAAAHATSERAEPAEMDERRLKVVGKIARRTVQILELDATVPNSLQLEDLHAWWGKAVRAAQDRGIYHKEIDAALKHVESVK